MENIMKFDLVLVGISLVALIFVVGYASPLVIAPLDEYESSDGNVLFVIEKADVLMIDDNAEFSSPDEYDVGEGLKISLEPGEYYWKAVGVLGSEVRTLKINSVVDLELIKVGDGFGVVNRGNVGLNVDVYDGDELVDKVKLGVGDVTETDGDKIVGGAE
tara:strand:+ start:342 stop:821 length:480 start_codon:yes stop_codon:yes gene_type:complete